MHKPKPNLQPTTMIPVFLETSTGMLDAAAEQLESLKKAKGRAHVLNDEMVERILKVFTEQTDYIPLYLQQCQHWRKVELNERQGQWLSEMENNIKSLAKVNQEILALVKSYQGKTINKVLNIDEAELLDSLLSGKIDSSF